jgi:GAF domain-containing protein/HAMP domain-containing protein
MNPQNTQVYTRGETAKRLFRLFSVGALVGAAICSIIYLRTNAWQNLAVAVSFLFALVIAGISLSLGKTQKKNTASLTALLAVLVGYSFPLLFWANAASYFIIGGGLVILVIASLLYPQLKYRIGAVAVFVLSAVIASALPLFPRYDVQSSPILSVLLPLITGLICIGAFWQFVRTVRANTIRTRLLVSYIVIAVLPMLIGAIAASTIGSQATIKSSLDLLNAVSSFKENMLRSWLTDYQETLHVVNSTDRRFAEMLGYLKNDPTNARYRIAYRSLSDLLSAAINRHKEFRELLLLDNNGVVLLSTDLTHQGLDLSGDPLYTSGLHTPTLVPPSYQSLLGENGVAVSEPVIDIFGTTIGILAGITDLDQINEVMVERQGVGETGETYLVSESLDLLTPALYTGDSSEQTQVLSRGAMEAIIGKREGSGVYENYSGDPVVGVYRWVPDLNLAIIAEQSRAEIFAPTFTTIAINTAISLAMIVGAIIFAVLITNSIANPLVELTQAAQRIAGGNLEINAPVSTRKDEITDLAISFNRMTEELRKLIFSLEQRVAERTLQLEQRTEQLQAASNLGSTVTMILDVDQLIQHAVELIQERFELIYVGIFLVDENRETAELKASAGIVNPLSAARSKNASLGEDLVGQCILSSHIQTSQDPDAANLTTLPQMGSRSEAALPLRSRGQVLGALNLHSSQVRAFDEATLSIYQNMADSIAVAIDNARLLSATQNALESTRKAYGEVSQSAWVERLSAKPVRVRRNAHGTSVVDTRTLSPEIQFTKSKPDKNGTVEIPIKIRNQEIGVVHAQKRQESGEWSGDEQEMLSALTYQLGIALESARLFEETLQRAEQERLVGEISNRIRETLEIDAVLRTAAKELRSALDLDEVEVRLSKG